jgi:hypothetical protein
MKFIKDWKCLTSFPILSAFGSKEGEELPDEKMRGATQKR